MTLSPMQAQMCEQQGRLFESLNARGIDPKTFIKDYLNSQAAKGLDAPYNRMQWAGEEYIFEEVVDEFGLTASPDAPKCNPEALYTQATSPAIGITRLASPRARFTARPMRRASLARTDFMSKTMTLQSKICEQGSGQH